METKNKKYEYVVQYTHTGWYLFCPVYLNTTRYNIHVRPAWKIGQWNVFNWLFDLAIFVDNVRTYIIDLVFSLINLLYTSPMDPPLRPEEGFCFWNVKKLKHPKLIIEWYQVPPR